MSRKLSDDEYRKTKSFRLKRWLDGTKDPFLDTVEMKAQKPFEEDQEEKKQFDQERKTRLTNWVYNSKRNRDVTAFRSLYRICAALFCVFC